MKKHLKKLTTKVDQALTKICRQHKNTLEHCDPEHHGCGCEDGDENMVDLVILIDSSSSMISKAQAVNDAATSGIAAAVKACGANVRPVWLWVDGKEPGTTTTHHLGSAVGNFSNSHQLYLQGMGAPGPFYHDAADGFPGYWQPFEKGAAAISDICAYFEWRERACRAVLYISDTTLVGSGSDQASNVAAVQLAVTLANQNGVTLFAHRCDRINTTGGMTQAQVDAGYTTLCSSTGGQAQLGGAATPALYTRLIKDAICNCKRRCIVVEQPEIAPCITVSWGNTPCDGVDSDDCQMFCIKVCNCYGNVAFEDFVITHLKVTYKNGKPVPTLPNGMPMIQAIPLGPVCFGTIPPCKDGKPSCVSRQFVLQTSGAKPGKYKLTLEGVCFSTSFHYDTESCYCLDIC